MYRKFWVILPEGYQIHSVQVRWDNRVPRMNGGYDTALAAVLDRKPADIEQLILAEVTVDVGEPKDSSAWTETIAEVNNSFDQPELFAGIRFFAESLAKRLGTALTGYTQLALYSSISVMSAMLVREAQKDVPYNLHDWKRTVEMGFQTRQFDGCLSRAYCELNPSVFKDFRIL